MATSRERILARALSANKEFKNLDFKREWNITAPGGWCDVLKDMVALANSGGGIIVFGVDDDGASSGADVSALLEIDPAAITDQIHKYTGTQFGDFEIIEFVRSNHACAAILVGPSDIPMVFEKVGEYELPDKKKKTVFHKGTIYFRHGAKSELCTREDLIAVVATQMKRRRTELLKGMKKVVEAPAGSIVSVASPGSAADSGKIVGRLTSSPDSPKIVAGNTDEVWPHRGKELVSSVNTKLGRRNAFRQHDLICLNWFLDVFSTRREFAHRPHKKASPQYSEVYADFIVTLINTRPDELENARTKYQERLKAVTRRRRCKWGPKFAEAAT